DPNAPVPDPAEKSGPGLRDRLPRRGAAAVANERGLVGRRRPDHLLRLDRPAVPGCEPQRVTRGWRTGGVSRRVEMHPGAHAAGSPGSVIRLLVELDPAAGGG